MPEPVIPAVDAPDEAPRVAGAARRWLPVAALLLLTLILAWQTQRLVQDHQRSRFEYETRRIESAIQERMSAYVQVLRGGLGLFQVAERVSREDWLRYTGTLELPQRYPGFKSLSYAEAVLPQDLPAFLERVRAEPLPPELRDARLLRQFTLRSPVAGGGSAPPIHAPIVFVAPLIPENERVLGVDMMQEAGRRAAMERSAQAGGAVLSPRLNLAGQGDLKAGFIAYLAVRRDERLLGWLTAAFRAEDFMHGLLGGSSTALDFAVYDGTRVQDDALLYSTAGIRADGAPRPLPPVREGRHTSTRVLDLPGRSWVLQYRAAEGFVPVTDYLAPLLVLLGGLLATALFMATARSGLRLQRLLAQVAAQNVDLSREIDERQRAEAEVRHQATHDPLTGLANRSLFLDRLQTALERGRRRGQGFALAYLDVDGFKSVNDLHGHLAGDELLRAIGERIQARLRAEDTLARLGGDEFAIVFEQAHDPPAAAQGLCADIVAALRQPFMLRSGTAAVEVRVGASIGVAVYPDHGQDCDALIGAADGAMYRAKRCGKDQCQLAAADDGG